MVNANVLAAAKVNDSQEDASDDACYTAARAAGVSSMESADECDDGACSCAGCPWQETAKNWRKQKGVVRLHLGPANW